jgi:hypothetical protein
MIGAFVSASVCIIDSFEGCEMSIMIPTRLSSATACLPNGDNPWYSHTPSRSPVFESDIWLWPLCASDMYRAPWS